ncbi:MAG TPA: sigma-54 dependent transcriptional regulator [Myxococcales bacterium]|nr:sigma-54 dependent transcriptional regulator [Myxococcales bacterium]
MTTILIVDDESHLRRLLGLVLREEGHAVLEADSVAAARARLLESDVQLVITDQKLGDGDGLAVLAYAREAATPVIFLTAYATVELAVAAMRAGAFDVIAKPFDPDAVKAAVRRALEHAGLVRENQLLRARVTRLGPPDDLVGDSPPMRRLRELAARVAPTDATVLITGETGSGKELVARAIHRRSARAAGPFVAVNCAAMAEGLLESELFGHEKGAFTGADRARPGMFEAASGGTLFLDEAGEMSASLQAKLLRVLTDGMVTRVGSRTERKVDVRLLVATHRDLPAQVAAGTFREDLYFRIAVVPIQVPPLRERSEDLPALAQHLLERACRELAISPRSLTPAALLHLKRYRFPGNVRELRNLIERACILSSGPDIGPEDLLLPAAPAGDDLQRWARTLPEALDLPEVLSRIESALIARAMEKSGGVQADAARLLGVSRSDLHYKLRKSVKIS